MVAWVVYNGGSRTHARTLLFKITMQLQVGFIVAFVGSVLVGGVEGLSNGVAKTPGV